MSELFTGFDCTMDARFRRPVTFSNEALFESSSTFQGDANFQANVNLANPSQLAEQVAPYITNGASNGVYDTGSNANGNWIRFDNGVMVQWMRQTTTDITNSGQSGSLRAGSYIWSYPQPFADALKVAINCANFRWGTGLGWGAGTWSISTTSATLVGLDVVSMDTETYCEVSAIAIGTWK